MSLGCCSSSGPAPSASAALLAIRLWDPRVPTHPSLSELSEGCVGTLGSQRRIASKAALALGAGPELEQQPKLILPVDRDAARGINLPDPAVYDDGGSCHTSHARR